jgi:hypothetical protein
MSLWLDDDELYFLTGKRQRKLQLEILAQLRPPIVMRVRPEDSFPLVERWQFEGPRTGTTPRRRTEPNYG